LNEHLIFFGLGVFCGIALSLSGALMLAREWSKGGKA
jgi:hypothetical protein